MSNDPQIQSIKEKIDVAELVGEYVALHRAGAYLKARCPFHDEKTPSFMVSPDRGTWHCFGCNEGGDIFSFIQKIEGLGFPETLELLARKAGVILSRERHRADGEKENRSRGLHDLLFDAAKVYQTILRDSQMAQEARAYVEGRGVLEKTRAEFMIGYAPDKWDVLYSVLMKRGYDVKQMIEAGVVMKNDAGRVYDRFRGRIMFPIWDHHGNVVGFTGRLLHEQEGQGKYVNTPQTPVFDKGSLLYGLDRAKQEIRKSGEAIIVEGQMDVISAHQAGYINTVASSGTALGEAQLKLLKRYCSLLKIAFDMDSAGQSAALRGIGLALQSGFDVRVITLLPEDGKDPDNCIQKNPDIWKQRVAMAQPYIAWAMNDALRLYDVNSAVGKRDIARRILPFIAKLQSAIERDHWVSELSHRLRSHVDAIHAELAQLNTSREYTKKNAVSGNAHTPSRNAPPLSSLLIGLALRTQAPFSDVENLPEDFFHPKLRPLAPIFSKEYNEVSTIQIRDALLMRVEHEYPLFSDKQLKEEYQRILFSCKEQMKKKRVAMLAQHIRDAEARGDNDRVAQLMVEYQHILSMSPAQTD